jgi:hypothetical protein
MRLTSQLACVALALVLVGLILVLAGCAAQQHPHIAPPLTLRHCPVTREAPGFIACDCVTPLVVWDAQLKRKVYYCDGKVQQ